MISSANTGVSRREKHGKSPARFPKADPLRAAMIASRGADTLRRAMPSLKVGVSATGLSDNRLSEWQKSGIGSPVTGFLQLIDCLTQAPRGRPGVLVTEAKIALIESVMPLSDAALVARYWALTNDEAAVEGRLNACQQMFTVTGDAEAIAAAARAVADNATELAAVAGEAAKRGIDLRKEIA